MTSQSFNPKVTAILQGSVCGNLQCQCVANVSKSSGTTHCPVCRQVSMWVGGVDGKVKVVPNCGCDAGAVIAALIQRGFDL